MADDELAAVFDLVNGFHATTVIIAAVRLGVFRAIDGGGQETRPLAQSLEVDEHMLGRLLNALEALSLVARSGHGYELTTRGQRFTRGPDAPALSAWVELVERQYLPAWQHLPRALTTGSVAFELAFGERTWEHRQRHPEIDAAFQRVMETERVRLVPEKAAAIAALPVFERAHHVVDVGGGTGRLLAAILRAHPSARGVLFDQQHVVHAPCEELDALRDRCELVGGSFFEALPGGADTYVLKHILHNWDDDACSRILARCRDAMGGASKLVIVESVLPSSDLASARNLVMLDIHMMSMHRGRERTEAEYAALLAASGCRIEHIDVRTPDRPDVIVASIA